MSTTKSCVEVLVQKYPDTTDKTWKRIRKLSDTQGGCFREPDAARTFERRDTRERATVFFSTEEHSGFDKGYLVKEGDLFPLTPKATIEALKKACAPIKHCGDYCHLYWSPATEEAWMTMGDGDCDGETFTSIKDIQAWLLAAGAKKVHVEAESNPYLHEGYYFLGAFGKTVWPT